MHICSISVSLVRAYIQLSTTPLQPLMYANERSRLAMERNGASQSVTMETFGNQVQHQEVLLQTVPVMLKNGDRRVIVNCLLDEGSNTTYVKKGVVE